MRVAINGWFLNSPATGTGQYLRHLIETAGPMGMEEGIELELIAPRALPAGAPVSVQRPFFEGKLAKVEFEHVTFPRSAKALNFTLAHIPHFGPPLYPSVPTLVTIHDLIPLLLPEYRKSPAVRLYTRLAAYGAQKANLIIADSEASRRDISKYLRIPDDRMRVIYLGVDSIFKPVIDRDELERVRTKYKLPPKFLLYLGGFDVRKNVSSLVDAFTALSKERMEGWKLVIAGRLPDAFTAFFPDPCPGGTVDVNFIGHVEEEDKPALYSSARLFAYPSRYEGFGLPPLEAMACGVPVVSSNSSSLPEVIGDGGILLDPFATAEWANVFRVVLEDDTRWRELRQRGLDQSAKFSWAKTARETLDLYRQMAASQTHVSR